MLYRNLLSEALSDRREEFVSFDREWRDDLRDYARGLRSLGGRTAQEIRGAVGEASAPGALPSMELERHGSMAVPFDTRWRTHEEARRWALEALSERVTFAADGSQLLPGREVSMPVAAVQVAWFENPHSREEDYVKQARFHIVSPAELLGGSDDRINAETVVTFRRFELETEALCEFMLRRRGWRERGERPPVAFFDGSLTYLISFALPKTKIQDDYANAVIKLLELSRETEVAVVGFIDRSYARDLVRLVEALNEGTSSLNSRYPYDAQLLRAVVDNEKPLLGGWGDRTIFCYYKRRGMSERLIDERDSPLIGFTYLQTAGDDTPARLDIPSWVYEAGLLDDVIDAVRAECVCGLGYPYAIESADEAALITARDREHFLRAIQDFARKESLAFHISRKAASKVRRR
ncbi:MAG: DNA double-strand break repair nuclease NurA [Pyrinomonadaceae bacterium]